MALLPAWCGATFGAMVGQLVGQAVRGSCEQRPAGLGGWVAGCSTVEAVSGDDGTKRGGNGLFIDFYCIMLHHFAGV